MGPKQSKQPTQKKTLTKSSSTKDIKEEPLTRSSFEFIQIIGRGGFGKVWKVYSRKYKMTFAMKEMSKQKIIDKRSEKSVLAERNLLSIMNHPFIINMQFAFQDTDTIYIGMEYLTGGDLRYQMSKEKIFNEAQSKFFIACVVLSLDYCHSNNIMHRDLKPENLVLDSQGYVKLTDFGIAKFYQKDNGKETSGTPGYMAPEVMCGQNHTVAVDYFALGVLGYEFMKQTRPYLGRDRSSIKEKMMAKQANVKKNEIPSGWSVESADFINRLLVRKPANRLGLRGAVEVKEHPWFRDYQWNELYLKKLVSPFIPKPTENFDKKYCNAVEKVNISVEDRYYAIKNKPNYKTCFNDLADFNRYSIVPMVNHFKSNEPIVNPHLCYIEEYHNALSGGNTASTTNGNNGNGNGNGNANNQGQGQGMHNRNNSATSLGSMRQQSFVVNKNRFGIEDDKYANLRRCPSAMSSNALLRGYKASASSQVTSNTNTGNAMPLNSTRPVNK